MDPIKIDFSFCMIFIVSKVNLCYDTHQIAEKNMFQGEEVPDIAIVIKMAPGQKCERCWCYSETVGKDSSYPTVCQRCVLVLEKEKNDL